MLAALLSALHLLTLGIGLAAVFSRGRALRALREGREPSLALRHVLSADSVWGVAAGLWLGTGLVRLFGELDKTLDFYLYNGFFWIKMGLFAAIFVLESAPMTTFLGWRITLRKGGVPDTGALTHLVRINDLETALVVLIPFVAAAMARGLWLTT
jgi:putative membrane protein